MSLGRILRSLWRRWYLTLAGLVVTALLGAFVFMNTSPTYERTASQLLIPGTSTIPEGSNPYLFLGGLSQAADVLVRSLNSEDVLGPVSKEYPTTSIAIARDTTTSGPIVVVTVDDTSDAAVAGAFDQILASVAPALDDLQNAAKVPPAARISVLPLTQDLQSTVIQKARLEGVVLVGAAGIVFTLMFVGLVDGLLLSRQRSRTRGDDDEANSDGFTSLRELDGVPESEFEAIERGLAEAARSNGRSRELTPLLHEDDR